MENPDPARCDVPGTRPEFGADTGVDAGPDREGMLAEQLLRLTHRIHRMQKRQLQPIGITPAQARLLRTVAVCDAPPRMADLAARLEVVPRAVTTLVDGLEANEWVRRVSDPTNRRVIRIEVTDAGRDMLKSLRAARRTAAEEALAPLSDEQRDVLGSLLSTLIGGSRSDATPPA